MRGSTAARKRAVKEAAVPPVVHWITRFEWDHAYLKGHTRTWQNGVHVRRMNNSDGTFRCWERVDWHN